MIALIREWFWLIGRAHAARQMIAAISADAETQRPKAAGVPPLTPASAALSRSSAAPLSNDPRAADTAGGLTQRSVHSHEHD